MYTSKFPPTPNDPRCVIHKAISSPRIQPEAAAARWATPELQRLLLPSQIWTVNPAEENDTSLVILLTQVGADPGGPNPAGPHQGPRSHIQISPALIKTPCYTQALELRCQDVHVRQGSLRSKNC